MKARKALLVLQKMGMLQNIAKRRRNLPIPLLLKNS